MLRIGQLVKHPLVINCVSYGGLYLSADVTQQFIKFTLSKDHDGKQNRERNTLIKSVDWSSATRFLIFGLGIVAPTYFFVYRWMDRFFAGKSLKIVFKKLAFDQLINSPIMLFIFFSGLGLMEHKSLSVIKSEILEKYVKTYVTGCAFWPPAQAINFALVPSRFRVIYVGAAAYVWTVFLSYIKHQ